MLKGFQVGDTIIYGQNYKIKNAINNKDNKIVRIKLVTVINDEMQKIM